MIGFIVATPLQLFNCMMIMHHHFPKEKCDLFALNIACDMHSYIDQLNIDLIGNAYYIERQFRNKSFIGRLIGHLINSPENDKIFLSTGKREYSHLFTTYVGQYSTWIYYKIKRKNPKLILHFYEEGTGVYVRNIIERGWKIKLLYKLLCRPFDESDIQDVYMYRPEIGKSVNAAFQRISIGNITDNDYVLIDSASNYLSGIIPYSKKLIYFESGFQTVDSLKEINEKPLICKISNIIGINNIIVRPHPRSNPSLYSEEGLEIDANRRINWEILLSKNVISKDSILVAPFSTALFSPKIMYDIEPIIIVTGLCIKNEYCNNIVAQRFWTESMRIYTEEIKSIYKDKSRVIVPVNFLELFKILRRY